MAIKLEYRISIHRTEPAELAGELSSLGVSFADMLAHPDGTDFRDFLYGKFVELNVAAIVKLEGGDAHT